MSVITLRIAAFSALGSKGVQGADAEVGADAGAGADAEVAPDAKLPPDAEPAAELADVEPADAEPADVEPANAEPANAVAPNTDKGPTNKMLRRVARGIMLELLPGLVRDDVRGGFKGIWAPIYRCRPHSVPGCAFSVESAGVI
jgi:hypothetical protein